MKKNASKNSNFGYRAPSVFQKAESISVYLLCTYFGMNAGSCVFPTEFTSVPISNETGPIGTNFTLDLPHACSTCSISADGPTSSPTMKPTMMPTTEMSTCSNGFLGIQTGNVCCDAEVIQVN